MMMKLYAYRGVPLDPPANSYEEAQRRTDGIPIAEAHKQRERAIMRGMAEQVAQSPAEVLLRTLAKRGST